MTDNLSEILEKIYDLEINVQISSFWDGQWKIKIGDEINGFSQQRSYLTINEVTEFLRSFYKNAPNQE